VLQAIVLRDYVRVAFALILPAQPSSQPAPKIFAILIVETPRVHLALTVLRPIVLSARTTPGVNQVKPAPLLIAQRMDVNRSNAHLLYQLVRTKVCASPSA
jgi:hypothetical protein